MDNDKPNEVWVTMRESTRIPQYLASREAYWAERLAQSEARARELWEALGIIDGECHLSRAMEIRDKHADHFREGNANER